MIAEHLDHAVRTDLNRLRPQGAADDDDFVLDGDEAHPNHQAPFTILDQPQSGPLSTKTVVMQPATPGR